MEARHVCSLVLLFAGVGTLLLSVFVFTVLPRPYARIHALSTATSLGAPLVALALAVEAGPGRSAVKLLVIGALIALSGPVTTMAIGRVTAQQVGHLWKDSPR
jgi:multicomponent Na+:H+ antiporter subunit G